MRVVQDRLLAGIVGSMLNDDTMGSVLFADGSSALFYVKQGRSVSKRGNDLFYSGTASGPPKVSDRLMCAWPNRCGLVKRWVFADQYQQAMAESATVLA